MLEPMFARSDASWLIAFLTLVNAVLALAIESILVFVPSPCCRSSTQVDTSVGIRLRVAVRGHVERGAVEQADAVEILGGHVFDVGLQGAELLIIQRAVTVVLVTSCASTESSTCGSARHSPFAGNRPASGE